MANTTIPNRPPLSPAAQAGEQILAYRRGADEVPHPLGLAAALRAAADQVVPEDELFLKLSKFEADLALEVARNKFFAIAAELEGDMLGDRQAARQFLREAGFTDEHGEWLPQFQPESDDNG